MRQEDRRPGLGRQTVERGERLRCARRYDNPLRSDIMKFRDGLPQLLGAFGWDVQEFEILEF